MALLLLVQLVACTDSQNKNKQPLPPPASPTFVLPGTGIIYGQPIEIRETTIPDSRSRKGEDITILDWTLGRATFSSPFYKDIIYWGTDFQPDSSGSEDHKALVTYLKTPFYKSYNSYSRTKEQEEYHFRYEMDTAKKQLRELNADPSDTSSYSIDYFSGDGFLIHRYVKLSKKEYYHLFYINDNHGNPVEERMVVRDLDFIQEKYEYEYDKEGNWLEKDLYHYSPNGQHFKMQFRRKITYENK